MTSFEAANQGYEYLAQIVGQHDLCTACLKIVGRQDVYVENVKAILHQKHGFDPERTRKITSALIQDIIGQAKLSERQEFSLLCANTLVALCGGLENLVKDVVAAAFLENIQFVEKLADQSLRVYASDMLIRSDEERARSLVDGLYQKESARRGHTERFMQILRYIDREIEIERQSHTAIDEAYEVRNVIVHRGGKVDARLIKSVPTLNQNIGNPVDIGESVFRGYRRAILQFADKIGAS